MKAYTDLNQSKKLSEILPLESADMSWVSNGLGKPFARTIPIKGDPEELCGCWSLAALLGVIREAIGYTIYGVNNVYMSCDLGDRPWKLITEVYDNEIDACVEMIIKLHEQKIL